MHTALFRKHGISLLCCSTAPELQSLFVQVHSLPGQRVRPRVVVLLDNVLDGCTGAEVYRQARDTQGRFNLDVVWVLVSSTEDAETIYRYRGLGVNYFIDKPLTTLKIRDLLSSVNYNANANQ
eukprot:Mrub_05996.p4 GENE.Mrub_05996~~Mrub_05996.p4  ORF type:complete len:123 (-),score=54.22 Mrub_05996:82-450(-)